MGYSFGVAARVFLICTSHRQDSTYHGLCYTSCAALAGTINLSWVQHEGSIKRTITPRANAPSYILLDFVVYYNGLKVSVSANLLMVRNLHLKPNPTWVFLTEAKVSTGIAPSPYQETEHGGGGILNGLLWVGTGTRMGTWFLLAIV